MTSVLLVDDDPRMQVLGRKVLERHGYRVVVAANGMEAATAAGREPFDVVLMDLEMPSVNGHQALHLVKAYQPGLPVVAVTAYAMAGDSERCRAEGFDDYISKPYDIAQLRALVARLAAER
jgi:CheY-like chemotaxis protein